jgi:hypothetical protein
MKVATGREAASVKLAVLESESAGGAETMVTTGSGNSTVQVNDAGVADE